MTSSANTARGRPRSEMIHAELLWAATRLVSERGTAATSTREIAAAAGTTERTLFKHFGSKDGLMRAVVEEAVIAHAVPASLHELTRAVESFREEFPAWHRALLNARLQALREAPELTRLLLAELLRDAALRARFIGLWKAAVWKPLVSLFDHLQRQGQLRGDLTAEAMSAQFLRTNISFLVVQLLDEGSSAAEDETQVDAQVADIAALFHAGVAAHAVDRNQGKRAKAQDP